MFRINILPPNKSNISILSFNKYILSEQHSLSSGNVGSMAGALIAYLGKENLSSNVPVCPRLPNSILGLFVACPMSPIWLWHLKSWAVGFSTFTPPTPRTQECVLFPVLLHPILGPYSRPHNSGALLLT